MPGAFVLVATPIGNLEDMTLRGLRSLREADLIAAEDTRHTGKLLTHFGITTRTVSLHEHNERSRIPELLDRVSGQRVAVVTDAGMPAISDPGYAVVVAAVAAGLNVEVILGYLP
jgi:16S rRNA (cytidine1402-2'-O)-methyltransferase